MRIENEFTVAEDVQRVWGYLLDVEKVAPCMPGAELTEQVDDRTWKGKVNVKVGPVAMTFAGTVTMRERDDAARRVVLDAKGIEHRGRGAATASVTSWLEEDSGSTRVKMQADLTLTGAAAQLSRGLLPEISNKLTADFASCLERSMSQPTMTVAAPVDQLVGTPAKTAVPAAATPEARPQPAAKPVAGIRLALGAVWSVIRRFFRRIFGRDPAGRS